MNVFELSLATVMIGPSSSHTAGAVRIGRIAGALLGETAVKAEIGLHGSFAKTYKGKAWWPIRLWSLVSWEWNPATGESGRVWFWPIDKEWRFLFMRCILTVLIPIRR